MSQSESVARHPAGIVARLARAANLRPDIVDRARRGHADVAHQRGAAIAVAVHAPEVMVREHAWDAVELAVILGREPGPVAGIGAAGAAALAVRDRAL